MVKPGKVTMKGRLLVLVVDKIWWKKGKKCQDMAPGRRMPLVAKGKVHCHGVHSSSIVINSIVLKIR